MASNLIPSSFDFSRFEVERDRSILSMSENPQSFAATLYTKKSGEYFSPYFGLNNDSLCCLTDVDVEKKKRRSIGTIPAVCALATVQPLGTSGKVGVPFLVTYQGQKYVVKSTRISDLEMKYRKNLSGQSNLKLDSLAARSNCLYSNIEGMEFLGSDEFTNETLVSYVLDYVYRNFGGKSTPGGSGGFSNYVVHYSSTVCNRNSGTYGLNLMEYADLDSLSSVGFLPALAPYRHTANLYSNPSTPDQTRVVVMTPSFIVDTMKQVLMCMSFFQDKVQFTHGDLKTNNIFLQSKPISASYRGVTVNSKFTVKIGDFGKSSLTVTGDNNVPLRLYNRSGAAEVYQRVFNWEPKIYHLLSDSYYVIDETFSASLYARLRHIGIPFYPSFDTYTFIISFLLISEVFYAVFTNQGLQNVFWNTLWFPDESSKAYERIRTALNKRSENNFETILNILKGLKLKCNLTENLMELLTKI